jgi:Mg-chelatase subunit ChlD
MNRSVVILFLLWSKTLVFAQNSTIESDSKVQNFGKLENVNNIQSQFIIKNNGSKNLYVLRADTKQGIKVRINKKMIPPGDTSTLYIYIEPKTTGKLDEEIQLVTSADVLPYILKVKGEIKSIKADDKTACFYFNQPKRKNTTGYPPIIFPVNNSEKNSDTIKTENKEQIPEVTEVLDRRIYKPNNITFLIDVSSSMKDSLKLPLMKESMYSLISVLRDIDKVNIITYSDEARIIKEGVNGDNKTVLNKCVEGLKAKGPTMGADAILFSLDEALHHYLENGNNQLFLITDGVFKFADVYYEKWKEKVGDKTIVLSIIALGKDQKAIVQLQSMAAKREGSFLRILNHTDAKTVVLEEIKWRAKR